MINDETTFIYIDSEDYGHPIGVKIKKGEFRPDFRISVHNDDPAGLVYVRDCGWVSYWTMDEVVEKFKS